MPVSTALKGFRETIRYREWPIFSTSAWFFIVGLIVTIFSAYNLQDLLSEKSDVTLLKMSKNQEMEIITKKGNKIKAMKVSKQQAKGRGQRLGVAYKLEDGTMVYVPEG